MRRTAFFALAGVAVGFLGFGSAWAIDYPVTGGDLSVSNDAVAPGDTVTVTGDGFAPGADVVITVHSTAIDLATVSADGSGAIGTTVTIPSGLAAGSHTLTATGPDPAGGSHVLSQSITVSDSGPSLAFTGGSVIGLGSVAVAVLVVGGLLVMVTRRRRLATP
jgi:hypothetical protein